jgi:Fe-S oxidoreductase
MARMKIEVLHRHHREHGVGLRDRLVSGLPRYAPAASRLGRLLAVRERSAAVAGLVERMTGLDRRRSFPAWHRRPFRDEEAEVVAGAAAAGEVALLADTFGRWFEPGALRDAVALLRAGGYRVTALRAAEGGRPLCCGRTFFSCGLVEEGREEVRRLVEAALPLVRRGAAVVGLEPSCLLTLRDEARAALPGPATEEVAARALLLEEFAAAERAAGRMELPLGPAPWKKALLHGHCHQKAFDAFAPVEQVLRLVPGLEVATVTSSCCGMAGAFGYDREHYDVSMRMAESALLPAVRAADADTVIVADGTSCRHQIRDGARREAVHAVSVLRAALRPGRA